jgi:4-amino-4-deoxy-L-arabinose transferase-like glycosyltransferase
MLRRPPLWTPLLILVAAGIAVRLVAIVGYWPGVVANPDSVGYLRAAHHGLFSEVAHPAGYPLFLRAVRQLSSELSVVVLLQHALGIAGALLLYATVRRLGGSRWIALIPAAVVLLTGDQIYYERAVLSEALFTFLLIASLYAAVRALDERPVLWSLASGALLAAGATVRTAGIFLVPVYAVWLLWAVGGDRRRRLAASAAAIAAAAAVMAGYVALQESETGYTGFARTGGWSLYARTAQFADCSKFTPPAGTERLCEQKPPDERYGPSFYHWIPDSPAWKLFGGPPAGDKQLGKFGRAVIVHQPFGYLRAVGKDALRYFLPHLGVDRRYGGTVPDGLAFRDPRPEFEQLGEQAAAEAFSPIHPRLRAVDELGSYQAIVRVHSGLLFVLLVLAAAGVFVCRARERAGVVLLGVTSVVVMLVPVATLIYAWRYAVPVMGPAAAAAALGGAALIERRRSRAGAPRENPVGSTGFAAPPDRVGSRG